MDARDNILRGLALMACGALLLPVGDAIAKHVVQETGMAAIFLAWSRFVIGAAIFVPVALLVERPRMMTRQFLIGQTLRGVLMGCALAGMVVGITLAPIAEVYGGFFIGPAVSALTARVVLKEPVRGAEWAALAVGLVGVWMVTQPGMRMSAGVALGLASGVSYGLGLAVTRWSAGRAPPLTMLAMQVLVGLILFAPWGAPAVIATGVQMPGWVVTAALTSAASNFLFIMAYRQTRAGTLAPVVYLQILSAAGLGAFVFGDVLSHLAQTGLAVILASGGLLALVRRRV